MSSTTGRHLLSISSQGFALRVLEQQGIQQSIERSLDLANAWHQRDCPLKAPLVAVFVLLMALKRDHSIGTLLSDLLDLMRHREPRLPLKAVTDQAMMHARARLGSAPFKALLEEQGCSIVPVSTFHGLRPWVVDGCRFTVPDTPANEEAFGRPTASRGRAAFPQMMGVPLLDATTRRIRDVVWGSWKMSEREACENLLERLGPQDLVLKDRGFAAGWLFESCIRHQTNFLCRVSAKWALTKVRGLGKGEYLGRIEAAVPLPVVEQTARRKNRIVILTVRVIEYRIGKNERVRLVTNLLDAEQFPAQELAEYYHLRWEVELAFDEIKTHLATVTHGTLHTTFRSKTPEGIKQEAYALLIAYNLIREIMLEAGNAHGIAPLILSFTQSLAVIRRAIVGFESARPAHLEWMAAQLLADIAACRIDRPRRPRTYPRVVKQKMSNFKLERQHHRDQGAPLRRPLRLVGAARASKRVA